MSGNSPQKKYRLYFILSFEDFPLFFLKGFLIFKRSAINGNKVKKGMA